jgi:hypothetical protein
MRIQFASDLHLETRPTQTFETLLEKGKAPILALLGDIAPLNHPNFYAFLEWCSEGWETVLYIPGALELFDGDLETASEEQFHRHMVRLKTICAPFLNVQILNRDAFFSTDGMIVLGTPFWSCRVTGISKWLRRRHEDDVIWVWSHTKHYTKPILVLSHYGPVGWVQEETLRSPETTSVFPQLELLLRAPIVAWMFGHIHNTIEYTKVWSPSDGKPQSVLLISNGLGPPINKKGWMREGYRRDGVLSLSPSVFYK